MHELLDPLMNNIIGAGNVMPVSPVLKGTSEGETVTELRRGHPERILELLPETFDVRETIGYSDIDQTAVG